MDKDLAKRIEERARALWEQDGKPEGAQDAYRAQAEAELMGHSVTGEEDPQEALDHQSQPKAPPER
jgi:hypothetical protein